MWFLCDYAITVEILSNVGGIATQVTADEYLNSAVGGTCCTSFRGFLMIAASVLLSARVPVATSTSYR